MLPSTATAQETDIVTEFLGMLSRADWLVADRIMAEDYQPLYPSANDLPGRDAWKQRNANAMLYQLTDLHQFTATATAIVGDDVLIWSELRWTSYDERERVTPYFLVLRIVDGLIVAGHGILDEEQFRDQM